MTNDQIQRFHETLREMAIAQREEADRQENVDTFEEGIALGKARGYIEAMNLFWNIVNEAKK